MITTHCLEQYLPDTGFILDAGSGPGRYAIDLAQRGYRVTMLDLVREMLELGQCKITETGVGKSITLTEGNLIALPYADSIFDAVVSLGTPLSHITDSLARSQAITEIARVVKSGGKVLVTGLQRLASFRGAVYWLSEDQLDQTMTVEYRTRGIFDGSQVWYTFAPNELEELIRGAGLHILDRVGCEGLANNLPMNHLEKIETDPRHWEMWKAILLETCNEPSILGISNHLLIVAYKS
ncbi:MAG: class I SAM-dependent methyltransferase [Chloroflexi bacterium]|nr:class I SAM-dependent methyltransferase [Chloroflexota bacterium]